MKKTRVDTQFYTVYLTELCEFQKLFLVEQIEMTMISDVYVALVEARPLRQGAEWDNAI